MRVKNREVENFGDTGWHDIIQVARRILPSPGIVIPIDDGQSWIVLSRQENRSMIATPGFVRWNTIKSDSGLIQVTKNLHRFSFMRAVAYIDENRFGLDESADHGSKSRQDTIKGARKTDRLASRPRKPSRLVRFPFRRHTVAELGRCFAQIHGDEKWY